MPNKARSKTTNSVTEFLGTSGRTWLPSELPTLRDVFAFMLLLKENDERNDKNYPIKVKYQMPFPKVKSHGQKPTHCFL